MAESLQDEMRRFAAMIEAPNTGVSLAHLCRLLRWGADEIDRLQELPETVAAEYGRKILDASEAYKTSGMSMNEMRQKFANLRPLTQKAIEAVCERVAADPDIKVKIDASTVNYTFPARWGKVDNHADMRVFVDGKDTRSAAPTELPADDPQLPRGGFF